MLAGWIPGPATMTRHRLSEWRRHPTVAAKRLSPCGFLPTGLHPEASQSPHRWRKHIPDSGNIEADEWRPCSRGGAHPIPRITQKASAVVTGSEGPVVVIGWGAERTIRRRGLFVGMNGDPVALGLDERNPDILSQRGDAICSATRLS